jgi:hypothetical protein
VVLCLLSDRQSLNLGVGGCSDGANRRLLYDAIMSKHNLLSEIYATLLQSPANYIWVRS